MSGFELSWSSWATQESNVTRLIGEGVAVEGRVGLDLAERLNRVVSTAASLGIRHGGVCYRYLKNPDGVLLRASVSPRGSQLLIGDEAQREEWLTVTGGGEQ